MTESGGQCHNIVAKGEKGEILTAAEQLHDQPQLILNHK